MMKLIGLASLVLPFSISIASADEIHQTATLDRASGETGVGADLMFIDDFDAGMVSRLDLHGQWMHQSGFGAYGQLAISRAFLDDNGLTPITGEVDTISFSNLELGGQFKRKLNDELTIVAHAGLVLPTSQDEPGAFITNIIAANARINDLVTAVPNMTALRLGVSPTWRRGAMFARADLGLDVVLDSDQMDGSDTVGHANVAIGMKQGKLSGAAELVTLFSTGDVEDGQDRFFHTAALSLSYDAGSIAPNLSVITPLDDSGRGEMITVGAGVSAKF